MSSNGSSSRSSRCSRSRSRSSCCWSRPNGAGRLLARVRDWLIAHARTVASVIILILALALLRNGIAGLV